MQEPSHDVSIPDARDNLPDLLRIGYTLLRYCGLHPKRVTGYSPNIFTITGVLYSALYVYPLLFCVYEIAMVDDLVNIMENCQLIAGYFQVTSIAFPEIFKVAASGIQGVFGKMQRPGKYLPVAWKGK